MDGKFNKPVVLYRRKDTVNKFLEAILKEMNYCKKIIKNNFNKNLVMSAEDEQRFQSSNKCGICDKLTRKVPVTFYNLGGHDCHLIMREIGKCNVKVNVIPKELEIYMTFTINNLVFIDSMQFMSSSLD